MKGSFQPGADPCPPASFSCLSSLQGSLGSRSGKGAESHQVRQTIPGCQGPEKRGRRRNTQERAGDEREGGPWAWGRGPLLHLLPCK